MSETSQTTSYIYKSEIITLTESLDDKQLGLMETEVVAVALLSSAIDNQDFSQPQFDSLITESGLAQIKAFGEMLRELPFKDITLIRNILEAEQTRRKSKKDFVSNPA